MNGDIAEIESVSKHPKGFGSQKLLLSELDYVNQKFDTLQKIFQGVPVHYIEGNHEFRIFRHVRDVTPQLWGMLHCPEIFKMNLRPGWMFHNYCVKQLVKCGKTRDLYLRHEPLVGGINHAKGTAEKSLVSLIYGHTHVFQTFTHKKFGPTPTTVTAYSNGFLGDINAECFEYRGGKDNWATGFAGIECDERTGCYEVRQFRI